MITAKCPSCSGELNCEAAGTITCSACQTEVIVAEDGSAKRAGAPAGFGGTGGFDVSAVTKDKAALLAGAAIFLALAAIIAAICVGVVIGKRTAYLTEFPFSDNAEKTAKAMFKNWIEISKRGQSNKAFMIQECASEMLSEYEAEVEEDDDMAYIEWKTKINEKPYHGYYILKKNKNGVYVSIRYFNRDDLKESERKWKSKMEKKGHKHTEKSKDFNWNVKLK